MRTSGRFEVEQEVFSCRTIDVPSCFIAGKSDWGVYQAPGAFERMQEQACTRMVGANSSTAPGTGCSRNSPRLSAGHCSSFCERRSDANGQPVRFGRPT